MVEERYKDIMNTLKEFQYKRDVIDVFRDCIESLALQCVILTDPCCGKERTERFKEIFANYDDEEKQSADKLIKQTNGLLSEFANKHDDYLGKLYMNVVTEYGKVKNCQFFTPYHISKLMAKMTIDVEEFKNTKKPITMNDPCCGAGGLCIAFLDVLEEQKINYLARALVTANDVDKTCVYMTYLQLNYAGAAAIIEHKDTLTQEKWDTLKTFGYYVQQSQLKGEMQ